MCLHGHAADVLQRRQTDTVVRGVKGGWGDEFHSAATRNSFGYVLLNHYLPADFGQEAIFPVANKHVKWVAFCIDGISASQRRLCSFFYCEMLHIDFLHVDFLSFFLSWGTFTSFLLTHRPQSDKLLWYIPVGAGGDPHPPDTLGLVLPICRSNWNTWTINFFSSPPRLWKEKAHILIKAWHHRSACICFIPGDYRRVAGCSLVSFRFQLLLHERHEAVHIKCVAT